jgi:peroxiredoxin (alkyl hydroperoxide reductase subunit C)
MLAMSIDSMFVHKMWDDNELSKMVDGGIPFPMLSDAGGKVGKLFGVFNENAGVENRGRFLIDPDGVVQAYEVLTPPVGRSVQETLRQLQAFQLIRETKGAEATPSGWKPGKQTLKPGPDLVGNVWKVWKTEMAFD